MTNKTDFFAGLILLGVCALFTWQIMLLPRPETANAFHAGSFPAGIVLLLALLALRLVYTGLTKPAGPSAWPERPVLVKIGKIGLLTAAYILGFVFFGEYCYQQDYPFGFSFITTTTAFLFLAQCLTRPGKWLSSACISVLASGCLFAVFFYMFKVQLP